MFYEQWGPTAQHRELYPISWDRTWWKIVWKKECTYICLTGSLCYTAEIDTTLQINYTLKMFFKKWDFVFWSEMARENINWWFEFVLFRLFLWCMRYKSHELTALKSCLLLRVMKIMNFFPDSSLPRSPTTIPTDGFIKYGESSYSLTKLKLQWHEAADYCKLHSSLIASILDPYSNAFAWMQMQALSEPVWIALNSNLVRC